MALLNAFFEALPEMEGRGRALPWALNCFLGCIYIVFFPLNWPSNLEFWRRKKVVQVVQIGRGKAIWTKSKRTAVFSWVHPLWGIIAELRSPQWGHTKPIYRPESSKTWIRLIIVKGNQLPCRIFSIFCDQKVLGAIWQIFQICGFHSK